MLGHYVWNTCVHIEREKYRYIKWKKHKVFFSLSIDDLSNISETHYFHRLITKYQKDHLKLWEPSKNFKNYETCSCVANLSTRLKPNKTSNSILEMVEGKGNRSENTHPSLNTTRSYGGPAIGPFQALSQQWAGRRLALLALSVTKIAICN